MQRLVRNIVVGIAATLPLAAEASPADTVSSPGPVVAATDSVKPKKNIFNRIISYFDDTNKPKKKKRFDVSFIGGPHYSSDTQLGLGLMAAGYYYMKGDTTQMPSNVSLYGDVSTVGFYLLGVRGNNIFPGERMLLEYNVNFYSFPTKFWGIGYANGSNKSNETEYDLFSTKVSADLYFRIADGLYIGPGVLFSYMKGSDIDPAYLYLWDDQRLSSLTTALGFTAKYDTRDSFTEPHSGWLVALTQRFAPAFLGNKMAFSSTKLSGSHYREVWKGGVLAAAIDATVNYGKVPWTQLATFGGSQTVRGYYEGRYRDKVGVEAVVELRQHVWRRNGIAVWAGAATVAPSLSRLSCKEILPCAGIGYRWEFKKRTNIRFDFGVGRGETAFIFNINEAF